MTERQQRASEIAIQFRYKAGAIQSLKIPLETAAGAIEQGLKNWHDLQASHSSKEGGAYKTRYLFKLDQDIGGDLAKKIVYRMCDELLDRVHYLKADVTDPKLAFTLSSGDHFSATCDLKQTNERVRQRERTLWNDSEEEELERTRGHDRGYDRGMGF